MSEDAANIEDFNIDDALLDVSSSDSNWFQDADIGSGTEASRWSDEEECKIKEVDDVILPNMEEPARTPGTKYNSMDEFRLALRQYCMLKEVEVKFLKSGPSRVIAVCVGDNCKWRMHTSRLGDGMTFQVKMLNDGHSCSSVNKRGNKLAGHTWIASKILSWLKNDPHLTIHTISTRLLEKYPLSLPYHRIWRAREAASEQIYSSWDEQYELVPHFLTEIQRSNPGSTVTYDVDHQNRFLRMFICLSPSKNGFLEGCRSILGLDGCHLKSRFRGICLSAVGVDGNYNMFPVAYSIVESESASSWKWFIGNLKYGLELEKLVFTSDRNKGLEDAVVNLEDQTRTCRQWQVTGLPCLHAASFISTIRGVRWEDYVSNYYTVARYKLAYEYSINPMTEKDEWETVDVNKVKPPLVNRQPQNARRKGKDVAGGPSRVNRGYVCKN